MLKEKKFGKPITKRNCGRINSRRTKQNEGTSVSVPFWLFHKQLIVIAYGLVQFP